jgi:aldose 1-epimerase
MSISRRPFPSGVDGERVTAYTLGNSRGASVEILDSGGIVRSIRVPDRHGRMADVALGQDSMDDYRSNPSCTGAILGRNANRIADASFSIDGKEYRLDRNLGRHNIHGGRAGYSTVLFDAEACEEAGIARLILRHRDCGEGGFPGTVDFQVTYSFCEDCVLEIAYLALPSEDTVLNPSNHCYFNLGGHDSGSVAEHLMKINAAFFTPNDFECMPTGEIWAVSGSAFDFTSPRRMGDGLEGNDGQVALCGGYDHNLCLAGRGYRLVAEVKDPGSGRRMDLYTDMPGVQLFTANSMPPIPCKEGVIYSNHQGFCLETQFFPNSANLSHFPSPIQRKNQAFRSRTSFHFNVEN